MPKLMGAKVLEDLVAWQVARALKMEVYALVRRSPEAAADVRFKSQLFEAAASGEANVAEGFHRYGAGEFAHFLNIARASIGEVQVRLQDGVDRGHFAENDTAEAMHLSRKAIAVVTALRTSLQPFVKKRRTSTDLGRRTSDIK